MFLLCAFSMFDRSTCSTVLRSILLPYSRPWVQLLFTIAPITRHESTASLDRTIIFLLLILKILTSILSCHPWLIGHKLSVAYLYLLLFLKPVLFPYANYFTESVMWLIELCLYVAVCRHVHPNRFSYLQNVGDESWNQSSSLSRVLAMDRQWSLAVRK